VQNDGRWDLSLEILIGALSIAVAVGLAIWAIHATRRDSDYDRRRRLLGALHEHVNERIVRGSSRVSTPLRGLFSAEEAGAEFFEFASTVADFEIRLSR
jgi:hypothetical protein